MRYCSLIVVVLIMTTPVGYCQDQSREEVTAQVRSGVFLILAMNGIEEKPLCSGFLVSEDPPMIATVASAVLKRPQGSHIWARNQNGDMWRARFAHFDGDFQIRPNSLVGSGPDLVLLQFELEEGESLGTPLSLKENPETDDLQNVEVLLLGFSGSSTATDEELLQPKATLREGIVERLLDLNFRDTGDTSNRLVLETNLSVDGDDLGAPVFDDTGSVVGIYIRKDEGTNNKALVLNVSVLQKSIKHLQAIENSRKRGIEE